MNRKIKSLNQTHAKLPTFNSSIIQSSLNVKKQRFKSEAAFVDYLNKLDSKNLYLTAIEFGIVPDKNKERMIKKMVSEGKKSDLISP